MTNFLQDVGKASANVPNSSDSAIYTNLKVFSVYSFNKSYDKPSTLPTDEADPLSKAASNQKKKVFSLSDLVLINKNKTRCLFFEIKKPESAAGENDEDGMRREEAPVVV